MRQGGSLEQYLARISDAHFVLDEINRRQRDDPAWQRVQPTPSVFAATRSVPA